MSHDRTESEQLTLPNMDDDDNEPEDKARPSGTLSIEVPKHDINEDSGSDTENGDESDDGNLSDSEMRRREEAGLNSPTGAQAQDSAGATYATAVDDNDDDGARDERGPRSPRRVSKNDEEKQGDAGGAVTQADDNPPAELASMLTQVSKDDAGAPSNSPITSVPRDVQPQAVTRAESDTTDQEIRRVSQRSSGFFSCCAWLNCARQQEPVDDEERTLDASQGQRDDLIRAPSDQSETGGAGAGSSDRSGGPIGVSQDSDGGHEKLVEYPDEYYEDGLLPRPLPQHQRQKCLVLDLDETLVHSSFKPVPNADFIIPVEIDGVIHRVYVMKRPYVDEFLIRCARKYEIVVFTASLAKYANPLLDQLDPQGTVTHRLFRESCVIHQTAYVKDLTRLARPISRTIIVDNSAQSYLFQPKNAIPIPSWFDDMSDTLLLDLLPVLETTMWEIPDVRKLLDAHTKSYRWLCNQANKTEQFM